MNNSRSNSVYGSQQSLRFDRHTSPLPLPVNHSAGCLSAATKCCRYLRRVVRFRQMDFQFALWQMVYLFAAPQKVYRDFQYRKQTKLQFARDDPAFLVLLCCWVLVSSLCFAVVLRLGVFRFLLFTLYMFAVDTLLVALIVATVLWWFSNRFLRESSVDPDVEWGYSFDVHLNAYFPSLVILHVLQLLLYHVVLSHDGFLSHLIGNVLWMVALGYYIYITFLGYSALPFIRNARVFLYLLTVLAPTFMLLMICGVNMSRELVDFYHNRVL